MIRQKKIGAQALTCAAAIIVLCGSGTNIRANSDNCSAELNIDKALEWFTPQRGVWTPLGWPDHLFRYTLAYNGTLICAPAGLMSKPHIKAYENKNFQLTFTPNATGALPPLPEKATPLYKLDGGVGVQRWREDHVAPVLQTDWPMMEGIVMRQEVFAHIKGGETVSVGTEPLYAWIRLSVAHVDPISTPENFTFGIRMSNNYIRTAYPFGLDDSVTLSAFPDIAALKSPLTSQTLAGDATGQPGLRVTESDGRTRLMVFPGGAGPVSMTETTSGSAIYHLKMELPATEGAYSDMLVPMLPMEQAEIEREAALGYEGALAECDAYWSNKPATAATIHTPESYINKAIARNLQFAQIIAERNPDTGEYAFLSGSYGYDALWSTPTSMIAHMFLDLLGYHDVVARHVELYKANQGSVKPPGPNFIKHPGYFSTPKTLTSFDWLTDHGAIMEMIARHALLTDDQKFIEEWTEPLLKACDFIKDSCANTSHTGVKGLLPPGVGDDTLQPEQAVWTQAWTYKGLQSTIMLLKRIGHSRADELASFATDYKKTFQEGFRDLANEQPTWTDPDGRQHPVLPQNLTPPGPHHIFDEAFRLDTGALCLPWSGLMDANDSLIESFGDYFRVGPPTKLWGPRSSPIARAVLHHEISSCEPCYSWNIVNSWQTGDRERFLEGMYALFAGAISPQTYINGEHRNAMYGTVFVAPLMTWCMRQAVIDDQIVPGELHLLRLCPLAWISETTETVFDKMPTLFGVVSLRFQLSEDGTILNVNPDADWRHKPARVVLHVPPVDGLEQVNIMGQSINIDGRKTIEVKL